MKNQALFSLKEKVKIIKVSSAAILPGAFRVNYLTKKCNFSQINKNLVEKILI